MKNRILWIFEDGLEPQSGENEAAEINSNENNDTFVALPWALFSRLSEPQRQNMQQIYRDAYEQAQAGLVERTKEISRFERLLDGVSAHELTEEY
jgi:hypothetical protein